MEVLKTNEQKPMFTSMAPLVTQSAMIIPSVLVTKESLQNPKQRRIFDLSQSDYDPLLDSHLLMNATGGYEMKKVSYSRVSKHTTVESQQRPETNSTRTGSKQRRQTATRKSRRRKRLENIRLKSSSRAGKVTPLGRRSVRKGLPSRQRVLPSIDTTNTAVRNIKFWRGTTPVDKNVDLSFPPITIENNDEIMATAQDGQTAVISSPHDNQNWDHATKGDGNKAQHKFYERHLALRDRLIEYETMHYREAVTRINRYRERLRKRPLVTRGVITRNGKALSLGKENNLATKVHIIEPANVEQMPLSTSPPGVRMSPSKEWKPYVMQPNQKISNSNEKPQRPKQRRKVSAGLRKPKLPTNVPKGNMSPEEAMSYPILGEKLLRGKTPKTNRQKTLGNNLLNEQESLNQGQANNEHETTEAQSTKSILVDLRKQLTTKQGSGDLKHRSYDNFLQMGRYEDIDKPRTAVGAKLRLLLHKSSQSEREHNVMEPSHDLTTDDKKPVSRATLKTQPVNLSSFGKQGGFPYDEDVKRYEATKHAMATERSLMVTGSKGKYDNLNKETLRRISMQTADSKFRSTLAQNPEKHPEEEGRNPHNTYWRRHIAYKKINTSVNKKSDVTAKDMQPTANQIQNPTNPKIIADILTKAESSSTAKKVYRMSIAPQHPTNNMEKLKSDHLLQQKAQLQRARQALFDPAKLAVTNFTAAILNSELGLRAPSSSPVDMFLKKLLPKTEHKEHLEYTPINVPVNRQNTPRSGRTPSTNHRFTINTMDGLSPATQMEHFEHLHGSAPPKVADLIDLQRLYDVMRKHGESFANLPFSLTSPLGDYSSAGVISQKDKELLKKQPFYHYPFPYQNPKSVKNMGMPLYVVTGAKALEASQIKTHKVQQKTVELHRPSNSEPATMHYKHSPRDAKAQKEVNFKIPLPEPIQRTVAVQKNTAEGYEGIRSVTVSVMKNPKPLERIKEH